MCLTDAADTLSKLVIIHNIGCVNIINIINWNITLALLPAAEEGQLNSGQLPDHDCVCVPGPGVCPCLLSALCATLLATCGCFISNCSVLHHLELWHHAFLDIGNTDTRIEGSE